MHSFWMIWLWAVPAFCQPHTTGQIGKAIQLRDRMAKELLAQDVRDYTIMLVDQHVKQVLWRSFFLKNLGDKETVLEARAKVEGEDPRRIVLIEDNLEELLLAANKQFPDDFDVMFATAYYLHRGSCCLIKPVISMTDSDILKIFEKADQLGKGCAQSTFALVKAALDSGEKLGDADLALLTKAHGLDVSDPKIAAVLLDQLLLAAKYPQAVQVAKTMYASQDFLQQKLIALHGSARAFYAMGRFNDVIKAVNQGLKLAPSMDTYGRLAWTQLVQRTTKSCT